MKKLKGEAREEKACNDGMVMLEVMYSGVGEDTV